ncbi:membrane protein [Gordonia phage Upyo]|nr:membrane protein [Gordonia phage Upyo]
MKRVDIGVVAVIAAVAGIVILLVGVGVMLTWNAEPGSSMESDVQRFHRMCADRGGFVADTSTSAWTTRIDCIVDNEVVYLPGFA